MVMSFQNKSCSSTADISLQQQHDGDCSQSNIFCLAEACGPEGVSSDLCNKKHVYLPARSLLILSGQAR